MIYSVKKLVFQIKTSKFNVYNVGDIDNNEYEGIFK